MLKQMVVLGALLGGAPLFSQAPSAEPEVVEGRLVWFRLGETKEAARRVMGLPQLSTDFGADFHSWRYRDGDTDHDDFSHSLIFRRSSGLLVAVTRTFPEERNVDRFFPDAESRTYCRGAIDGLDYCVRVRRVEGARLLIAGGVVRRGDGASTLVLIFENELGGFFPWLVDRVGPQRR